MARSLRLAVAFAFGLLACSDPVAGEIAAYHEAMDPLMAENTRLASRFLVLAMTVRQDRGEAQKMDKVVQQIETDVVPAADALKANIEGITSGIEELRDVHSQATTAWGLQAQAYREMVAAYKANDPTAFVEGQKKLGQAKVTIENYVREVNRLLEPYGYHLDEFPPLK